MLLTIGLSLLGLPKRKTDATIGSGLGAIHGVVLGQLKNRVRSRSGVKPKYQMDLVSQAIARDSLNRGLVLIALYSMVN